MILDVALDKLPPDNRMVFVRFEELCDVFGPSFDGIESFLAEHTGQVTLDSDDSSRSEVVTEDPKRQDGLRMGCKLEVFDNEWKSLPGDKRHHCVESVQGREGRRLCMLPE